MKVPQHLEPPRASNETYGTLRYADGAWHITAEPQVRAMIKAIFPGAIGRGESIRFIAGDRGMENLNWILQRYPLKIEDPARYEVARRGAIDMALHRAGGLIPKPVAECPFLKGKLFPYQAEDVGLMLHAKRILNGNAMGLGKTVEALATIAAAQAFPALIVVQPHVLIQWERNVENWLDLPNPPGVLPGVKISPRYYHHRIVGLKPYPLPEKSIIITHYGLLNAWRESLLRRQFKAIIFDEVQELRRPEAKKYGAALSIASDCPYVIGLSGTPIYGYGKELHSVMNVIERNCLGSEDSFIQEWGHPNDSRRVKDPKALGDYLRREGLMFARKHEDKDVASQLPGKRRIMVAIDQDDELYRRMIEEARRTASVYEHLDFAQKGQAIRKIEQWTRHAAGLAKARAVGEFVHALVQAGERVILAAHHHDVHDALQTMLGDTVVRITGRETGAEKTRSVERFAAGEVSVCLIALRAATGVDGLQAAATAVVFAELDWAPAVHDQLEGRAYRHGLRHEGVLPCYYLVAGNSYDDIVREILGLKVGQYAGIMGVEVESAADPETARHHMERLIQALKR